MFTIYLFVYGVLSMTHVISARIDKRLLRDIDFIVKVEMSDRGSVIRRLLREAVKKWRIDYALRLYQEGKVSLWRAAKIARLSLWEFIDILADRKVSLHYSLEELEEDIKYATQGSDKR